MGRGLYKCSSIYPPHLTTAEHSEIDFTPLCLFVPGRPFPQPSQNGHLAQFHIEVRFHAACPRSWKLRQLEKQSHAYQDVELPRGAILYTAADRPSIHPVREEKTSPTKQHNRVVVSQRARRQHPASDCRVDPMEGYSATILVRRIAQSRCPLASRPVNAHAQEKHADSMHESCA